jgi:hypothetical protein
MIVVVGFMLRCVWCMFKRDEIERIEAVRFTLRLLKGSYGLLGCGWCTNSVIKCVRKYHNTMLELI